ncbi:transporter substrate-binding domain-containing protein [uncultured Limimaricola sp.]|uniref:substrate-binding periplasmic protein n=1 Tax=uncultured Limimaricola sp. TaxID=2211667 RepID=UPI0030F775F2
MRRAGLALALGLALSLPGGGAFARCEDYVPQPKPQNADRDYMGQTLDEILDRGFIEFAVYADFPPWSYEDNGVATGVDVEIGRLIARDMGVEARFRLVAAGEDLAADLRNWVWKGPVVGGSVANVMLHVPYDSAFTCRVEQVVFTGLYDVETLAIAYDSGVFPDDAPLPAYFRMHRVGVENDSISDFYLSAMAGGQLGPNISRHPTLEAAMAALAAGEVTAVMGPRAQLEADLGTAGLHVPPFPGLMKPAWPIGLAVHQSHRDLGYMIEGIVGDAVADGRIAAIFDSHGLSWTAPEW